MGGQQAAEVLATVRLQQLERQGRTLEQEERDELQRPILEKYEVESDPYYSTARLWDDGIIDPVDTRTVVGLGHRRIHQRALPGAEAGRVQDVTPARFSA